MREHISAHPSLAALDRQLRRKILLGVISYSLALAAALAFYFVFPFPLSRAGSVVMAIGFAHMLGRVARVGVKTRASRQLSCRIDAQLALVSSTTYNLPLLVGANVFLIGLPGTGSALGKAWFDCWFLLGSVTVLAGLYLFNQRTICRELVSARQELAISLSEVDQ